MRIISIAAVLLIGTGVGRAGDLNIRLMVSGEVAPGVYGQVNVGNEPPPPLVYAQPTLIEPMSAPPPPVYLHVPPGHARNWRKHCHEYNACNRPVYFVKSAEYAPGYERHRHDHDHDHGHDGDRWRDGDDDHGHGHGHGHDDR